MIPPRESRSSVGAKSPMTFFFFRNCLDSKPLRNEDVTTPHFFSVLHLHGHNGEHDEGRQSGV